MDEASATVTVVLTVREARALRHMGALMAGAFEEAGCDLGADLEDGMIVSPLVSGIMRLEVALVAVGADPS